jgi:hypothetical protein
LLLRSFENHVPFAQRKGLLGFIPYANQNLDGRRSSAALLLLLLEKALEGRGQGRFSCD